MVDNKDINQVVKSVIDALPEGVKNLPHDLQQNLKIAVKSVFGKMDLLTREEFDAQMKVLQRTRKKCDALEQRVKELEQKFPQE